MKANELRIGNLIQFQNGVEENKVIEITPRFFSQLAGGRSFEDQKRDTELNGYYHHIPLTEEWLLKFGFTKNALTSRKYNFYPGNWDIANMYEDGWLFGNYHWETSINIKYVHQLQNLYFALTGEELIAK